MSLQKNNDRPQVLVCTHDDGIVRVRDTVLPTLHGCTIYISHQVPHDSRTESLRLSSVIYERIHTTGLARNRNNCLQHIRHNINLITDDDVSYVPDAMQQVTQAFVDIPDADIILFNDTRRKKYTTIRRLGRFLSPKHTTVLMAFRGSALARAGVSFDERFGIGATYPIGEDAIFLHDCWRAGLRIYSHPMALVHHDGRSTGECFTDELIRARVQVFFRMHGVLGALGGIVYFVCMKTRLIRQHCSIRHFIYISVHELVTG